MGMRIVITEDEKNKILNLYGLLNEQEKFGSKAKPVNSKSYNTKKFKVSSTNISTNSQEFDSVEQTFNTSGMAGAVEQLNSMFANNSTLKQVVFDERTKTIAFTPQMNKLASEMMSMMINPKSAKMFNEIRSKNMLFFAYALGKYDELSSKYGKQRHIQVSNSQTMVSEPIRTEPLPEPKTVIPGYTVTIDKGTYQGVLFKINDETLSPEFQEVINGVLRAIEENIANTNQTVGTVQKLIVSALTVKSSCSTAPNMRNNNPSSQFNGRIPGFEELSEARGNKVYETVANGLQQIAQNAGVELVYDNETPTSEFGVNFKGDNNDGTSGPKLTGNMTYKDVLQYQRADIKLTYGLLHEELPTEIPAKIPEADESELPKTINDYIIVFKYLTKKPPQKKTPPPKQPQKSKVTSADIGHCDKTQGAKERANSEGQRVQNMRTKGRKMMSKINRGFF